MQREALRKRLRKRRIFCGRNETGWGYGAPNAAEMLNLQLLGGYNGSIHKTVGFQEHVRAACIEIVVTFEEE